MTLDRRKGTALLAGKKFREMERHVASVIFSSRQTQVIKISCYVIVSRSECYILVDDVLSPVEDFTYTIN
jgi:hypothetical protein